jgi:shikimate kinase
VAEALARRLGCRMIDLDYIVREREHRSVPALIDEEGEAKFRESETASLCVVLETGTARVMALGGGMWMLSQNRGLIAQHHCLTVWLNAPFELCWQRIVSGSEIRPLARDREKAHGFYDERHSLYALAALHVRANEERGVEELVSEIIGVLKSFGGETP